MASGVRPTSLSIDPAVLGFLDFLSAPKSLRQLLDAEMDVEPAERRGLLRLLVDAGIVDAVKPRQAQDSDHWWDPRDRAKYESSLLALVQIAHGFTASAVADFCVDHWGRPVPWLARPVIDYLSQIDLSGLDVFEFGGGASTFYWERRCRSVVCVESSQYWYQRLSDETGPGATIYLRQAATDFAEVILETDAYYDIILIDAAPAFRAQCVRPALARLSSRGMIILDDAPFYPEAAAQLRRAGLLEVDLTGYSPLENNFQTTALFMQRTFDLPRQSGPSPAFPFGSPHYQWSSFRPD